MMLSAANEGSSVTGQYPWSARIATHSGLDHPTFSQHTDADLLGRLDARDAAIDRLGMSRDEQAMEAARSLVSIGLVQPMLALARRDPFRSELFHGGQGEEIFGAKLDAMIAERVTKQMGLSLVDSVYKKIVKGGDHAGADPARSFDSRG